MKCQTAVACSPGDGLAVSTTLGILVVTNSPDCTISVYETRSGSFRLTQTFGGVGDEPLKFRAPGWCCFTPGPAPSLLVTEGGNGRLQEVGFSAHDSAAHYHLGFLFSGALVGPQAVAASADAIAVSESREALHRVSVFDRTTLALLCHLGGDTLSLPSGLRFTRDGGGLLVADTGNNRVVLFSVAGGAGSGPGASVRTVAAAEHGLRWPRDVEEWEGGILVANTNGNSVLVVQVDRARGEVVGLAPVAGVYRSPMALACLRSDLQWLVREAEGGRLQVFQ